MRTEVVSHGELLIDFSQSGQGPLGFPSYEALPGGGPANMAVALAAWHHRVGFSGRVGEDALGGLLRRTLENRGVDTTRLLSSPRPTSMAIVSLDARGERGFDFLWKGTSCEGIPACQPDPRDVPRVFHFSSVSMSDPEGRRNNLLSARRHGEAGSAVSFDPNLRLNLWPSADEARNAIREGLSVADIVKIADEEMAFALEEPLSGIPDQARRLAERYDIPVLFVTLGAQGCLWFCGGESGTRAAPKVTVADTTGAGDCFMAGVLHVFLLSGKAPAELTPAEAAAMAAFGVAAGSASTVKRGGIPAIPALDAVVDLIR